MDMSLIRRSERRVLGRGAEDLDYRVLVATLQAWQLSTATARAEARCGAVHFEAQTAERAPLAEILLGSRDWQQAVLEQGGSFNPLFARVMTPG
jgi:hypothetical protein